MTDEHRMEGLSRAYVQAVAAACGCTCARPEPDYGVDLVLRWVTWRDGGWGEIGPALNVQLRSTSGATATPDHIVYDLAADTYKYLRRTTLNEPSILVLVTLPSDPAACLDHTEERLELRGCGYWLSLHGAPATANTSSVRVRIPRQNQFTPAALERIMGTVRRRKRL